MAYRLFPDQLASSRYDDNEYEELSINHPCASSSPRFESHYLRRRRLHRFLEELTQNSNDEDENEVLNKNHLLVSPVSSYKACGDQQNLSSINLRARSGYSKDLSTTSRLRPTTCGDQVSLQHVKKDEVDVTTQTETHSIQPDYLQEATLIAQCLEEMRSKRINLYI